MFVDCRFRGFASDIEEEEGRAKLTRRQVRDVIRLDKSMLHFTASKHRGEMPTEGKSLLDMGFTIVSSPIAEEANIETMKFDVPCSLTTPIEHLHEAVAARTEQPPPRQVASISIPSAISEPDTLLEQKCWSLLPNEFIWLLRQVVPSK